MPENQYDMSSGMTFSDISMHEMAAGVSVSGETPSPAFIGSTSSTTERTRPLPAVALTTTVWPTDGASLCL